MLLVAFLATFGINFESWDLILAALFLWITLFLAALSANEIAAIIFSVALLFFATLTATSSFPIISLFMDSLFLEPLRALLAVVVTGIR